LKWKLIFKEDNKMNKDKLIGTIFLIVVVVVFVGGGYWIWRNLTPSKSEVNTKEESLRSQIKVVSPDILDKFDTSQVDKFKTFGTFPITVPPELLGRTNPFSGS
jgi:cytoskeletal protein RodZ